MERRRLRDLLLPIGWRLALVLAGGLVLLSVWQMPMREPRPMPKAKPLATLGAGEDETSSLAIIAQSYPSIGERPLFFPTRARWQPPPPPPAPPPVVRAPPPPTNYALAGIIISGDNRTALVKSAKGQQSVILAEGQQLDGWTLQRINENELLFVSGKSTYEMKLPKPSEIRR